MPINIICTFLQGPGAEQFFHAQAPLLFNKLWLRLQLQICSDNFTFKFEILIHNTVDSLLTGLNGTGGKPVKRNSG